MRSIINYLIILLLFVISSTSVKADVARIMERYLWEKRVVLIFAPNIKHQFLLKQTALLDKEKAGVLERDIVVLSFVYDQFVRVNNAVKPHLATRPFYQYFRVEPNEYSVILFGKDGTEKLRQNTPLSINKLFSVIDAMPMRQEEIKLKGQ